MGPIQGVPPTSTWRLFWFNDLAHDCVVNPHNVLLAVTNQRVRYFAVSPISNVRRTGDALGLRQGAADD